MQRQRGELVPIGEALADLGGPIQALRETPPPARRGFTVADQVNQLVGASEADPENVKGGGKLDRWGGAKLDRSWAEGQFLSAFSWGGWNGAWGRP